MSNPAIANSSYRSFLALISSTAVFYRALLGCLYQRLMAANSSPVLKMGMDISLVDPLPCGHRITWANGVHNGIGGAVLGRLFAVKDDRPNP